MTYPVRRLTASEGAIFRDIRLEALKLHASAFGSDWQDEAVHDVDWFTAWIERSAVFGAFDNDRMVGTSSFFKPGGRRSAHLGRLASMYVRSEARGTGTALALVNTVLDHAATEVIQVHLSVATDNAPAIRLYEKAGFTIYGTEPRALKVDGRYIDEHLMVRFLEGARKEE